MHCEIKSNKTNERESKKERMNKEKNELTNEQMIKRRGRIIKNEVVKKNATAHYKNIATKMNGKAREPICKHTIIIIEKKKTKIKHRLENTV
jgi:hypothetical protein